MALSFILLTSCATPGMAQRCNASIAESTPTTRFILHDDGTLTDTATQLQWQRCSEGQHWTGNRCEGHAQQLSINDARRQSETNWRLPSLPELSSVVELQCSRPAINLRLFPNTPAGDYWSTTDFANSQPDQPRYWQVQFIDGETNLGGTKDRAYLRLVRDAGRTSNK